MVMKNEITVSDMYDMMLSLNKCTKFGMRETTIAAAMDFLSEKGVKDSELGLYEREIRARVPLEGDKCQK
jgi:hypothetical protein